MCCFLWDLFMLCSHKHRHTDSVLSGIPNEMASRHMTRRMPVTISKTSVPFFCLTAPTPPLYLFCSSLSFSSQPKALTFCFMVLSIMHNTNILSFCSSDMHMHVYSTHTHSPWLPRAKGERT